MLSDSVKPVFINRDSPEPKGSASILQGFRKIGNII